MIKNLFKAEWHKTQLITKNSVDERQENKPKTSFQSKHQKLRLVPSLLATYTMLGAEGFEGIVIQSPLELGGTRHMDQERAPFSQTPDTCSCFTAVTTYLKKKRKNCSKFKLFLVSAYNLYKVWLNRDFKLYLLRVKQVNNCSVVKSQSWLNHMSWILGYSLQ